jgi:ABC-2 type transport system ATP-binding protein
VEIENARDGRVTALVESPQGRDIRSEIAAGIVGKGWPLLELRGVSLSLEDIFLELTTEDSAHAQPAELTKEAPAK